MNNRVRTVFNRRKQASDTTCAAVEIVVCLGRERFYFSIGIFLNATQWLDGKVINHPKAAIFNEQIQKKVTEFERIIIAMEVNGDDMTTQQFKNLSVIRWQQPTQLHGMDARTYSIPQNERRNAQGTFDHL